MLDASVGRAPSYLPTNIKKLSLQILNIIKLFYSVSSTFNLGKSKKRYFFLDDRAYALTQIRLDHRVFRTS